MSAASVTKTRKSKNPATGSQQNATAPANSDKIAAYAAVWGTLAKLAGDGKCEKDSEKFDRDALADGSSHRVDVTITGFVDGMAYTERVAADLTVGHTTPDCATSQTPKANDLIGYLLSQVNERTRTKILRDLPEMYAQNGGYPDVPADVAALSQDMLKRLRAKVRAPKRGSVSVKVDEVAAGAGSGRDGERALRVAAG